MPPCGQGHDKQEDALTRLILLACGLLLALVLAGCATLSEQECQAGDWRSIGRADGANGRPLSYLGRHNDACADYGVAVNRELYEAGREEGLRSYCRLGRAECEGREGSPNHHVCAGRMGVSFDRVYDAARQVHEAEQDVDVARARLDGLIDRIDDPDLTDEQRSRLRREILSLRLDMDLLRLDVRRAERDLRDVVRQEERRLAQS